MADLKIDAANASLSIAADEDISISAPTTQLTICSLFTEEEKMELAIKYNVSWDMVRVVDEMMRILECRRIGVKP